MTTTTAATAATASAPASGIPSEYLPRPATVGRPSDAAALGFQRLGFGGEPLGFDFDHELVISRGAAESLFWALELDLGDREVKRTLVDLPVFLRRLEAALASPGQIRGSLVPVVELAREQARAAADAGATHAGFF